VSCNSKGEIKYAAKQYQQRRMVVLNLRVKEKDHGYVFTHQRYRSSKLKRDVR
jgi:hypothetical protein